VYETEAGLPGNLDALISLEFLAFPPLYKLVDELSLKT
jgi:hypothetical protein